MVACNKAQHIHQCITDCFSSLFRRSFPWWTRRQRDSRQTSQKGHYITH